MLFLSFLAYLSSLAFSIPIYIFVGPVTHYSCRLGLMGFFAIYLVNSLWPLSLGFSAYLGFCKWPSTIIKFIFMLMFFLIKIFVLKPNSDICLCVCVCFFFLNDKFKVLLHSSRITCSANQEPYSSTI